MSWFRAIFCLVLLLAYIYFTKQFSLRSPVLQIVSGTFLALDSMLYVFGAQYTTPANAVLLLFIFPWICLFLDYSFLGRKPSLGGMQRSVLGLLGVGVLVYEGLDKNTGLGDICALAAGACIAIHIFFSQRLSEKYEGNKEVLSSILFGWVLSVVAILPFADLQSFPVENQFQMLLLFALLSAVPWLFWAQSVAHVPGYIMGALLGVEVFVAALLGWWLLGESLTIYTWVGGGLTLIAAVSQIVVSSLPKKEGVKLELEKVS